jgi:hypothetical protein
VLQFAAFVVGLAIVGYQWRFGRSSLRMALGLALSLGAVTHLLVSMRILHLALIGTVPVLAFVGVVWLFRKYWPRREAAAEAPGAGAAPAMTALAIAFTLGLLPQASAAPVTNAFSIVSAEYTGKVQDNVGQFTATIQVATFGTNQVVPLFGEDLAIQEFSGDGRLMRIGKTVSVRIESQGSARLQFKLAVKLGGDVTKRQLAFAIPPALSSKLGVVIDEPDADVEFPSAVAFARRPGDSQTQVDAVLGSGDRVDLHWTPRVKRITEMAASIFVQNTSLVTVGAGVVNTRSVFEYQISQGELRQARIQIPARQRLLRVEGELFRTWELHEEGDAQVLVVDLVKGVAPAYRLTVETEKMLETLPTQVQTTLPHAMNVIREMGIVGIRGSDELTLTVENAAELQRVDNAEFEKAYPGKGLSILAAYRFFKPGFQLTARAEPVTPYIAAVVRNAFRVGFEHLTLNSSIDYVIKKAGVFTLRFALPTGYRVESVSGGSNVLHWVEKDQNTLEVTLKQRTMGNYSLALQLVRTYKEPPRTLELLGVTPAEVQKLTGFVSATSEQGIALKTSTFTGLIEIPASALGEGKGAVLAFKHLAIGGAWQLALATELVESWVRAEVANIISISETLLSGRTVIRYDIQNAPVKEFRLRVPAAYKNVEILGTNIRRRDQTGEEWRVELQSKERGTYTLTVTFEQARDGRTNSAVELVGVETLGTERETGAMVILAKAPLQVAEKAASEEMLKVDARELPDWAGVSGEAPALVYRYLRPGYRLALEAKRFEEAAVLQALIDSALFTTVIADDGQMMTEMSLRIRNNGLQHLEIQLPAQTEVWSAFVDGQPVRPAKRNDRLLLPLERSAQDASVAVQLTYVGTEKFPKTKGTVNLSSPRLDVPLKNARWEVYLPPDYDYSKFAGTMMHEASAAPVVKVYSSSEYVQQEEAKKFERSSESKRSLGRAKSLLSTGNVKDANEDLKQAIVNAPMDELTRKELEGLKREVSKAQSSNLIEAQRAYTADNARRFGVINESAPAEQPVKLLDYDAEVAERQWEVLQRAQEVSVAKVQPLRVNLPTRGLRHSFTQVLQTEVNKPMTVEFRAANSKDGGWFKFLLNGVAAFALLWMLTAVVLNRTPKSVEDHATA